MRQFHDSKFEAFSEGYNYAKFSIIITLIEHFKISQRVCSFVSFTFVM